MKSPFLLGILRDICVFSLCLLLQHYLDPPYRLALNSDYILPSHSGLSALLLGLSRPSLACHFLHSWNNLFALKAASLP